MLFCAQNSPQLNDDGILQCCQCFLTSRSIHTHTPWDCCNVFLNKKKVIKFMQNRKSDAQRRERNQPTIQTHKWVEFYWEDSSIKRDQGRLSVTTIEAIGSAIVSHKNGHTAAAAHSHDSFIRDFAQSNFYFIFYFILYTCFLCHYRYYYFCVEIERNRFSTKFDIVHDFTP